MPVENRFLKEMSHQKNQSALSEKSKQKYTLIKHQNTCNKGLKIKNKPSKDFQSGKVLFFIFRT
jgi:hypothetical protein